MAWFATRLARNISATCCMCHSELDSQRDDSALDSGCFTKTAHFGHDLFLEWLLLPSANGLTGQRESAYHMIVKTIYIPHSRVSKSSDGLGLDCTSLTSASKHAQVRLALRHAHGQSTGHLAGPSAGHGAGVRDCVDHVTRVVTDGGLTPIDEGEVSGRSKAGFWSKQQ